MSDLWADIRNDLITLGADVAEQRRSLGLAQQELVDIIEPNKVSGWDVPTLSRIEAGRHAPSAHIGTRLSQWLLQTSGRSNVAHFPTPARSTDPDTSHTNRPTADTQVHGGVKEILRHYEGGLAHFEIVKVYLDRNVYYPEVYPQATEQRIRTATKELVDIGEVYRTGYKRKNDNGRACIVWALRSTAK